MSACLLLAFVAGVVGGAALVVGVAALSAFADFQRDREL